MDRILIEGLRVHCTIGADEAERREKQDVVISLAVTADLSEACQSDRLEDTVDYRSLRKRIVARIEESEFFLIEALAEAVAGICLEHPLVSRVVVRVDKPAAFGHARSVGVEVTRERTPNAESGTPETASVGIRTKSSG